MAIKTIKELEEIVLRFKNILKSKNIKYSEIYLFGSYINGTADEWSDIDLAVVCEKYKKLDRFDMQFKLMKIAKEIDIDIEPHVFFKEDFNDMNPFVNIILTTNKKVT
jgi:predicted nucleotidyltransferase